ncbi:MAG: lytic transglycosylase domain-containing protein [Clostridiales bacterium]|nr:lytic transglycosylase domain-containing protein [Clostridiales bacterium]
MLKKLLSVWLVLVMLFASTTLIYAEDTVQGTFLNRNIEVNGTLIRNYYLKDPIVLVNGSTYLPLTEELGALLGFEATIDRESHTIKLLKTEAKPETQQQENVLCNLEDVTVNPEESYTIVLLAEKEVKKLALPETLSGTAAAPSSLGIGSKLTQNKQAANSGTIQSPQLLTEQVLVGDYKVLVAADKTLYVPLKVLTGTVFNWSAAYESYSGLYIGTTVNHDAQKLMEADAAEINLNKGLTRYIMATNKVYDEEFSREMVFWFKHEADVNDMDITLLMGVASGESSFNEACLSRSGAVGVMQIMPRTAKGFGLTVADLYNAKKNIELGARIVSGHIDNYDSVVVGLSAYNAGSGAVNRGSYTTAYANRILNRQQGLLRFLLDGGYVE